MEAANLNNHTGNALVAGAPAQTADQVASEFMDAYNKKKRFKVSGGINRFSVKLMALMPNSFIASMAAKTFQKRTSGKS